MSVEPNLLNANEIRQLVNHPGWTDTFLPMLKTRRENMVSLLVNGAKQRREDHSDEFLRASIQIFDTIIAFGPSFLREWEGLLEQERREEAVDGDYAERAELGHIGPR